MHVQDRPDGLSHCSTWLEKIIPDGNLQLDFLNMRQSGLTLPCRDGGWNYKGSPWNYPGKNTGIGSHFPLQGIFLTQGSNLGLLHCRQILSHLSHQGSPEREWRNQVVIQSLQRKFLSLT